MIKKIIGIVVMVEVLLLSIEMLATFSLRDTYSFYIGTVIWHWVHFPASFLMNEATRPHAFGMNFDPSLLVRAIVFFSMWLVCVAQMILVVSGIALCCSYVKQKLTG